MDWPPLLEGTYIPLVKCQSPFRYWFSNSRFSSSHINCISSKVNRLSIMWKLLDNVIVGGTINYRKCGTSRQRYRGLNNQLSKMWNFLTTLSWVRQSIIENVELLDNVIVGATIDYRKCVTSRQRYRGCDYQLSKMWNFLTTLSWVEQSIIDNRELLDNVIVGGTINYRKCGTSWQRYRGWNNQLSKMWNFLTTLSWVKQSNIENV